MRRVCNRCGSVRLSVDRRQEGRAEAANLRPMSAEEMATVARSIYGARWLRPLARFLECNPGLVRQCKKGERVLTGEAAARVRALADIGPAGAIVRRIVEQAIPDMRLVTTHNVARRIVIELSNLGLLEPDARRKPVTGGRPSGPITGYPTPRERAP